MPTSIAPSAMFNKPTLSGTPSTELDSIVVRHVREVMAREPGWDAFVAARAREVTMRSQLAQFAYIRRALDRFVGTPTPPDLQGAGGVAVSRQQVLTALGQKPAQAEVAHEIWELARLYGERGVRGEDARVVRMLDEVAPVTPQMHAQQFLKLLRDVHRQWEEAHPA
ncbi:uncharacterized protein BXZ73DRAFT_53149 [Epithele typhae]|uniref:uncharacterized protein n=1 Tax=Epithele typhae TaxID=378194 RepID=UPI002007A854|nr:uncharacterized protein BXZ73DRAFT_53149 [Epithele typhae]KAH9917915.1 hypothetical protein BXZ73DRAFT_53149 [Epithele typhae]